MIDLGETIDAEATPGIEIERKSGGAYNEDGEWGDETIESDSLIGVMQPAMGTKLLDLPEAERNEARFFLWTREALVLDDVVLYGGKRYRIMFVWERPEGGFTRAALGLLGGN